MIYKNLRTIPMITFIEIIETMDLELLSDEKLDPDELILIWQKMNEEYQNRFNKQKKDKIFTLNKEIKYLDLKYLIIKLSVEALKFKDDEKIIEVLHEYGYKLNIETYNSDLIRIERECEGIIQKINHLKKSLPTEEKSNSDTSHDIINLMAAYSAILGFDFDFYAISVEKFYSLENQVKQKVAAIEKNNLKK